MRFRLVFALPLVLLASACSSDDEAAAPAVDGGADTAAEAPSDAGDASDATTIGDGGEDGSSDAADDTAGDAAGDAGGEATVEAGDGGDACHAVTFGAPAASITNVASLPTMTGGAIPAPAVFDAVDVQTTGSVTGTYRATWSFRADGHIESIEQLTLGGGTPPAPVPRTLSYTAEGSTLTRTRVCGGDETFTNQYRVRTAGPETFLEVRQDTVMFVFKMR